MYILQNIKLDSQVGNSFCHLIGHFLLTMDRRVDKIKELYKDFAIDFEHVLFLEVVDYFIF